MSLLSELKRRNVFRVATFYAGAGWVLLQAGDLLFDALDVPPWALKLLLGLLLLGFPLAIFFAWAFELTPEGLKREHEVHPDASITAQTATKLNMLIVGLLVVAIGLGVANWLGHASDAARASSDASAQQAAPAGDRVAAASAKGATGTKDVSIAVLPFVNMSDEKANEYFSDGLTEELLNVLANVQGLRVIARTSSFAYKGKDVKIADVARELSVDHVLEGSVRKSGNKVRITTQLIRASDSSHLWSDAYDRSLEDIFAVQDEISGQVVDALKLKLLTDGHGPLDVGGTRNAQAYEALLLGRHFISQGEKEDSVRAALKAFEEAIRLDPSYAQAYAGKAFALSRLASNAYIPYDIGFEQCRQAALRSLELAPDLAEGHLSLAQVQSILDGNVSKAAMDAEPIDWQRITDRALIFAKSDKKADARNELAALQSRFGDNASYQYAQIETQLGDKDAALRWLENARRVRDPGLVGTAFVDPMLDPLRGDPRFEKLVRDLGFVNGSQTGA